MWNGRVDCINTSRAWTAKQLFKVSWCGCFIDWRISKAKLGIKTSSTTHVLVLGVRSMLIFGPLFLLSHLQRGWRLSQLCALRFGVTCFCKYWQHKITFKGSYYIMNRDGKWFYFTPSSTNYGLIDVSTAVNQESTLTVRELLRKVDIMVSTWMCVMACVCVTGDNTLSSARKWCQ